MLLLTIITSTWGAYQLSHFITLYIIDRHDQPLEPGRGLAAVMHCCPDCGSKSRLITNGNCSHLWHHGVNSSHVNCHCRQCRRQYSAAIERGKPRYRPPDGNHCYFCAARIRKHVWVPGWENPLSAKPGDYSLCEWCVKQHPDGADPMQWMAMDIVR